MYGNRRIMARWLSVVAVFFIIISSFVQTASANSEAFDNLKGEGKSGKVDIAVDTCHQTDSGFERIPDTVRIKFGDASSYVPVITNKGSDCHLRLRLYANTETQSINILKYCYGWEDNWKRIDDWFYYDGVIVRGESVRICQGFEFPDEWRWRECNVLSITVEAEAVADEEYASELIKTGDESRLYSYIALLALSIVMIVLTRRKNKWH